jgi:3-methyladenine DNA glycosylase AlkD
LTPARPKSPPPPANAAKILRQLRSLADPRARAAMARFGVIVDDAHGIPTPVLRKVAKRLGANHALALELWKSGNHESRHLAAMIADPHQVTPALMELWARDFNSWDIVDGTCWHPFGETPHAWRKAAEWTRRQPQYVKRAGFALMAYLAIHDKTASDAKFERLLPHIRREAGDARNFVKKAVNWALRNIGKRDLRLNRLAIRTARQIRAQDSPAARWVAADALRELSGPAVQKRLRAKARKRPA